MEIMGFSFDVLGAIGSALGSVILLAIGVFVLGIFYISNSWRSFNKDVVIVRGKNKLPLFWRGKVVFNAKNEKELAIADNMWNAFFKNYYAYPLLFADVDTDEIDVFWFELNKSDDLVYLKFDDMIQQIKDKKLNLEEWKNGLTKKELNALEKFRILPATAFSGIKFTEVVNKEIENRILTERMNAQTRTDKPSGFLEKYGMYIIIIIGLLFVWLIVDGANKSSVEQSTRWASASESNSKAWSDMIQSISSSKFCTKFCTNETIGESVIYTPNG